MSRLRRVRIPVVLVPLAISSFWFGGRELAIQDSEDAVPPQLSTGLVADPSRTMLPAKAAIAQRSVVITQLVLTAASTPSQEFRRLGLACSLVRPKRSRHRRSETLRCW